MEGLDLDISEFSYTDGKNIYLEEDADAPAFEKAYKEKWGEDPVSHEQNDGDYSRIRDMDMYKNPNKKEEPQRSSIGSFFDNSNAEIMPFLEMSGYEPKTTFWTDFSIADAFGEKAVEDTFNRAFNEWKNDKEYVTELVMMLNWKIWSHHDKGNEKMARLYDKLWTKADKWAMTHLKGDDLKYFLRTTD